MPVATVSTAPEKFDLKTCEGAYVVLRRMSYGQKLHRQQTATQQAVKMEGNRMSEMDIKLLQQQVVAYEFAHCIVEHNLEDADGRTLNFLNPQDVDSLDPRIGEEINALIEGMNNYEGGPEDQKGNS